MAAPVWVLSVDLQTKTATFQSGMAEAAKSARGAFTDIKGGSKELGSEVGGNMGVARHGVMLLTEEFGVHLPRGLVTFLAELGPVGAAMEAAFPFLAIILGATLLLEHLAKMREEGQKLTEDQVKFGLAAQNAFNGLDDKLLQAGIRADDLNNNHLGALAKQLTLIDHQSLAELAHEFGELAKSADSVFEDLKSHWYTFGIGSSGAKHALTEFQGEYQKLLAQGKDSEAADLLKGTRDSAQKVLDLQKQAAATAGNSGASGGGDREKLLAHEASLNGLKSAGVGYTEKEVQAQQTLLDALNAQVQIQGKVAELKKQDDANVKRTTAGQMSAEAATAARAAVESQLRIGQQAIAADRATATAQLDIHRASVADREAVDVAFADRELALQLSANHKELEALDKLAKDYPNALKGLHEKAEELEAQHAAKVTEIQQRATIAQAAKDLQTMEQSEREKIEITQQGSAARLSAIAAALHAEEAAGLQDTSFYRDLLNQRVEAARQASEEEAKEKAQAGALMAAYDEKMGSMSVAAQKEHQALIDSSRRMTDQMRVSEAINAANQDYAIQLTAIAQQIAALDKGGKDYNNKLLELQNKQKEMIQAHENEITAIKDKAEIERNSRILGADKQFNDTIASGMTQALMGHKSFAAEMNSIGNTVVTGMMENAIKSVLANDFTKESDAAAAARKAYLTGEAIGGPAGIVLGPIFAAAAFASVMAFQSGTDYVPGFGTGDKVPAMLEPGEGVVPGGVMDNLRKMASSGNMGGGDHYHAHVSPTYHLQALDTDGMDKILKAHAETLSKHVGNELRRMNH
jgi:hypothetical protein